MRATLLTVVFASLYAAGYVLFNGLDRAYELFGLGFNLGGGEALAASLAAAGGAFALWFGVGYVEEESVDGVVSEQTRVYSVPILGVGVVLLGVTGYLLFQGDSGTFLEGLRVGDCFQTPADTDLVVVEVVSCDEPHDHEVFAVRELPHSPDDPFPGFLAVDESAFSACVDDFEAYVDAPYETSDLDFFWIVPTEASWADDDRWIVCSLVRVDFQRMTGSAKGLGQ